MSFSFSFYFFMLILRYFLRSALNESIQVVISIAIGNNKCRILTLLYDSLKKWTFTDTVIIFERFVFLVFIHSDTSKIDMSIENNFCHINYFSLKSNWFLPFDKNVIHDFHHNWYIQSMSSHGNFIFFSVNQNIKRHNDFIFILHKCL